MKKDNTSNVSTTLIGIYPQLQSMADGLQERHNSVLNYILIHQVVWHLHRTHTGGSLPAIRMSFIQKAISLQVHNTADIELPELRRLNTKPLNMQNAETRRYAQGKDRSTASIVAHPEFLASSVTDSL